MWPVAAQVAWLLAAGVLAGTASASDAIGSLVSYPALLAVGLGPVTANVTNAVAVTAVGVGASFAARDELREAARGHAVRWATVAAVGGLAGSVLLLTTPAAAFEWVVPFLVLTGVVALVAQPRIRVPAAGGPRALFPLGLLSVATYEGYFGAGAGVLTLALVLLTVDRSLPHANAVKNGVLAVADAVAGVVFVVLGSVAWVACGAIAVGYLGGGLLGPRVVRRVRPAVLRGAVAVFGIAMVVVLLARAAG